MATELELLDSLEKYEIVLGIATAQGMQTVLVEGTDPDGTVFSVPMKVADVMYFTEYGTITIPGRRVLEKSLAYASGLVNEYLSNIVDKILSGPWTEAQTEAMLRECCQKIGSTTKSIVATLGQNVGRLSGLLGQQDENKYLFDANELSKYVSCTLRKR